VTPLVLLLIALVLLYVCVARWTRGERTALGLNNEVIVSADDSAVGAPTLRSTRYGLVGRPDQLVRVGRILIPVEQKPSARRIHQSHVLQLAAQCLLVHEVYWKPGLLKRIEAASTPAQRTRAQTIARDHTPAEDTGRVAADCSPRLGEC